MSPACHGTVDAWALARQQLQGHQERAGLLGITRGIVSESGGGKSAAPPQAPVTSPAPPAALPPNPPPPLPALPPSSPMYQRLIMGALNLVAVLQVLRTLISIKLTWEAESAYREAEEAVHSRKPDEALPLLERALSKCDEYNETEFYNLCNLVRIRMLHARFYATCNPPQPVRVREWLDKAEAKCKESRHVRRPFSWAIWIFSFNSPQDRDSYTLRKIADIKLIEGGYEFLGILGNSSSRGGANTQWMTSFEQAAILTKQSREIDIINAGNGRVQTDSAKLALYTLRDILRASLTGHPSRGYLIRGWAPLKDSVAPEDYDRRFVKDNREIIERIASICAWAIQSCPHILDTGTYGYFYGYVYPHDRAHEDARFQFERFEMYGLVGRTFLYLGDSCDNSKAMAGQKREYFERARINLELAVAVIEEFSSSDNDSDAPGWLQFEINISPYLRDSVRKDREEYNKLLDQMKLRL